MGLYQALRRAHKIVTSLAINSHSYRKKRKKKSMCGYFRIYYFRCSHFGIPVPINEHTPRCPHPISVVSVEDSYCLPCLRRLQEMERVMMLALREL